MMREGLARSIEEVGHWEVCGQAASSKEALERIPEVNPDLVTMDISLPDKNGLELIKDLLSRLPKLLIMVYSMHDEVLYAERVMRAGGKGYLMKGEPTSTLMHAIDTILKGGIYLTNNASGQLLKNLSGVRSRGQFGLDRLSDRELEIFELIGGGKSNVQIGGVLHISPKTVDAHRSNIKTKLGIPDAPSLMRAAVLWIERGKRQDAAADVRID